MKKLISFLLVASLILSIVPLAFAAHVHDDACGYIAPNPCSKLAGCDGTKHDDGCDFFAGSPCTYKEPVHKCSYGIYDALGDGTHAIICTGNVHHRIVEACWSDNNRNHKCDHCGWVMSEHEFTYTPAADFSHRALCYCSIEFAEPCSFVDELCEKCGRTCRTVKLDADTFNAMKEDSAELAEILADSQSVDMLWIDNGSSLDFRTEVDKPALEKLRAGNSEMGICVSNDSFSLSLGGKYLEGLEDVFYVESRELDDGFAVELGSGDEMLVELDAGRMSPHWGTSSLRCSLDLAASETYEGSTKLFSLGLSGDEAAFAPIDTGLLEREKLLSKTRYTNNTEVYPYAKTAYDRALADFSELEQPVVNIRLAALDTTELHITGSEGSSYLLAPDADGIFESDMILSPGRVISGYAPAPGLDFNF